MKREAAPTGRTPRGVRKPEEVQVAEPAAGLPELDFGILPRLIARQLRIAQLMVFKDFSTEYAGASLSPGSFEILELLTLNPGIGPSRLGNAIGLEKSSMVPAIARLEDLELIERRSSATDKRAKELRTTPKGRKALTQLRRYVVAREQQVTRGMSSEDIALLNALLKRLAEANSS